MLEPTKQESSLAERLSIFWCAMMHDEPMWPIHGNYRCRLCGRSYLVPWEGERLGASQQISSMNPLIS
jgi:hypothetical protein